MKTLLLALWLLMPSLLLGQELHIHPRKANGWLASTVTKYSPVDGEGYSIPTQEITTAELSPADLANFSVVVGYFVSIGAGEWDAVLVTVEPSSPAIVSPTVTDEEGVVITPAVTRQALALAVTVERNAAPYGEKTETMSTEDLPAPVREAALSVWNSLTN